MRAINADGMTIDHLENGFQYHFRNSPFENLLSNEKPNNPQWNIHVSSAMRRDATFPVDALVQSDKLHFVSGVNIQ